MRRRQLGDYYKKIQELTKEYKNVHSKLATYLEDSQPELPKGLNGRRDEKIILIERYEKKVSILLRGILGKISETLALNHEIKPKKAVLQFNSSHKKVTGRISIPWYGNFSTNKKEWNSQQINWARTYYEIVNTEDNFRSHRDILFLQPDKPSHLITEIIWRFNNDKSWIGVLKDETIAQNILGGSDDYLCGIPTRGRDRFIEQLGRKLNEWRMQNSSEAVVDLGKDYNNKDYKNLTERAFEWLHRDPARVDNIFFVSDIIKSEQLAGVAMELSLPVDVDIEQINNFIKECQWLLNQYVYTLILNAEKTYSVCDNDTLYRDAYFHELDDENGNYEMAESLIKLFGHPSNGTNELNGRFHDEDFMAYKSIKEIFKKLRTHLALSIGPRGTFIRGYKHHAYEVACTTAGIMDILFKFGEYQNPRQPNRRPSIEAIIRKSEPNLSEIDKKMEEHKSHIPFLFRQLFKGLGKEDQLFLIPQYRDHFIHSFYVFIFGFILMCYAPKNVVPSNLRLKKTTDEKELLQLLQKWFLVSMWHDIAYMVEKGNMVLEQHITSFLNSTERSQGLLPWHPSLGNLMQAKGCLDEIRELSGGVIKICENLLSALGGNYYQDKLSCDVVVATAFDRRDHGIWSALMLNHAWDDVMSDVIGTREANKFRKEIVKAIMPHHIANWEISSILKDYNDSQKVLFKGCGKDEVIEELLDNNETNFECRNGNKCSNILATVSSEENELGYLLGLCDIISQAGREAPELSINASRLGIKYEAIESLASRDQEGSLCIKLHYKDNDIDEKKIKEYFLIPALFLGLENNQSSKKEALMIKIGEEDYYFSLS